MLHDAPIGISNHDTTPHEDVDVTARTVHDLGNLIQVASSALNMLARSAPDDGRTARIVSAAQISLSQASDLVRRTLKHARSEAQVMESFDPEAALLEIETLCHAAWGEQHRFHMCIAGELPRVGCDKLGFRTAILNLVTNARAATPNGGDIGLAAIGRDDGAYVEICVADNGIGMTEETVRRATEPFFTTKAGGLGGVGLPSVERFVRAAGGRMEIRSKLNVGTVVMLTLPASNPETAA